MKIPFFKDNDKEKTTAQTIVEDVCAIKKGESVLIIANPETSAIAQDLYTASLAEGASPSLMFQPKKSSLDMAEKAVVGAIKSEPDVIFSISANKLGKDEEALANPYTDAVGQKYSNIFDYLLSGKKSVRAVWTPGLTQDMYERTVNIDYRLLSERCKKICSLFENAKSVKVTSPAGTDFTVCVEGRKALVDDGDFTKPGTGGNVPSGEVFISPVVGKSSGVIVFDGSMTFSDGDAMLETPIRATVKDGFVTDIQGDKEAKRLLKDITAAEKQSATDEYRRNARNIGELGIGLNPAANITGNMLEDEKAFRTCHFAIGENYDGDAPALIHFDGIVCSPTIEIEYPDGTSFVLLEKGDLKI